MGLASSIVAFFFLSCLDLNVTFPRELSTSLGVKPLEAIRERTPN
jgi:hypothetical protein